MTAHDLGLYAGAAAGVAAAIVWVIIPLARGLVRPDYRDDDTDTAGDAGLQPVPGVHGPVHFSGQYRGLPHQQQARELKANALRSGLPAAEIHDVHGSSK